MKTIEAEDTGFSTLVNGEDFMSKLYMLSAGAIDYTLVNACSDNESMQAMLIELHNYTITTPIHSFFRLENIRDNVTTTILSSPYMHHYFMNLDHVLMMNLQSKLGLEYKDIVETLINYIKPTISSSRKLSVLDDGRFIEQNINLDTIKEVLLSNSFILTVYLFKISYSFSQAYGTFLTLD